jgi:demethylmenaquinone methyltransferase/2-methoxy-6-polyprenyl-1,4-benzoquinol methylase
MTQLTGNERGKYVQGMFAQIADRYDVMNRLMTGGQDVRWRKQVIRSAALKPGDRLLDLGAGTGDLAREALTQHPGVIVTAADFTIEMMRVGQQYGDLDWSAADALNLPFPDRSFNAIVSGFLMRNVGDIDRALSEQYRALASGGRIVILDTTRPQKNILSPFIWIHMHLIIPFLGGLLSGFKEAYHYLPDSTEGFLTAEELQSQMIKVGFKNVQFERLMFGTIAIHLGFRE